MRIVQGLRKLYSALTMQPYACELGIDNLGACVGKGRYESKASLHEYTNLHSASEGSKHNSLACVIADLFFSLLQLKKQVRGANVYFYGMSADTSKHKPRTPRFSPSNSIS